MPQTVHKNNQPIVERAMLMYVNSAIINSVPKGDIPLFEKIVEIFSLFESATSKEGRTNLPRHLGRVLDINPECHTIALAITMLVPEMKTQHGIYVGVVSTDDERGYRATDCAHSWNVTPNGTIIDSYPVGVVTGGPAIVASHGMYQPFGSGLYVDRPQITSKLQMYKIWSRANLLADVVRFAQENQ